MHAAFILVAAGAGKRFGSAVPKAFVELEGVSLLRRSFMALQLEPRFRSAVVVLPTDRCGQGDEQIRAVLRPELDLRIVAGGHERQHSVRAGLRALPDEADVIVVHDAARPFVTVQLIAACLEAALVHGAATATLPVTDTVKEIDEQGAVVRTLDRSRLRLVQTPQAFRREVLVEAHARAERGNASAPDDAALVEQSGGVVWTVPGDAGNLKITMADDLAWARWRLASRPR